MRTALVLFTLGICALVQASPCDNPDPDWLLCEDFEYGGGDWDAWFAHSDFLGGAGTGDRGRVTLSDHEPHGGSWAACMPASAGSGYQGASLDWRACDGEQRTNCSMRSFDQLYFRVWVRFAEDHRYVHHFLNIGGSQPDDYWYHGTAGCLPNGELSMSTTVDFRENSHESHFYTYFPEMNCDTRCERYADVDRICAECADKGLPTCTERKQCCWGNHFEPDPPFAFPVGTWFCFEMMMKANTPGEHDGAMAFWVDDSLILRVDSMMWRTSPTLALNRIRVQHYITTSDAGGHSNRVWFDDVVVSTGRIGMGASTARSLSAPSRGRSPGVSILPAGVSAVRMMVRVPRPGAFTVDIHDSFGRVVWRHHGLSDGTVTGITWNGARTAGVRFVTVTQDGRSAPAVRFRTVHSSHGGHHGLE